MDTDSDARVIRPGEPDHPAEQVKNAEGGPRRGVAVWQIRVAAHGVDRLDAPSIAEIEGAVSAAVSNVIRERAGEVGGYTVNVDATRTDL